MKTAIEQIKYCVLWISELYKIKLDVGPLEISNFHLLASPLRNVCLRHYMLIGVIITLTFDLLP